MNNILVFLDGELVYRGKKEGFVSLMKSLSNSDVSDLVVQTLKEGHVVDNRLGDFELITEEAFNKGEYSLKDFAIKSYERQLEDCEDRWRAEIEEEIRILKGL